MRGWTGVAWWFVPVIYALLLASPSVTLPGDDLGIRAFETPPLGPDIELSQSFRMTADGLHAIEVYPVALGPRVSGEVRFDLYLIYEVGDSRGEIRIRSANVLSEDLMRTPSYRFEFAPIPNSKDSDYRLDFGASSAEGVAFLATKGERYDGGYMSVNNSGRWADLAFRAYAPAPSVWRRLMTLRETNTVRAYLVIAALPAIWLLVGFVIRILQGVSDESVAAIPPPPITGPGSRSGRESRRLWSGTPVSLSSRPTPAEDSQREPADGHDHQRNDN
jgi:hypothetical protein